MFKKLKEFFGDRPLREISRRDVERFQASLRGKKTKRLTSRKGATVNRYIYLLSAIFSRAAVDEIVDFNPCSKFEKEPEARRERYLMPAERTKLMDVLVDDLEYLRSPIEVSLGTGELLELRIEHVNFSGLSVFRPANGRDVEVRPNWLLLADTKGKAPRHRVMPMNVPVRAALHKVIQDRTTGRVFDYGHTGVSASTAPKWFQQSL